MPTVHYTTLSPAQVADQFSTMGRDVMTEFGHLDAVQLNWQPQAGSWSVAQCFDHLLKINGEMTGAIDRGLRPGASRTIWQRLPLWPKLFGRILITSQAPGGKQKYKAPPAAVPAASDIAADVIKRFTAWQDNGIARVRALNAADEQQIAVSPFVAQITYSVLDAYRLIAAHQRRHFEQAQRVMAHPAFPRSRRETE
jgi:hypothetical protein